MAAPKGNQYAKGKATGRPKIWTDEAIEEEANALLEWIQDPKHTYIGKFAFERGYDRAQMHHFSNSSDVFANAYKRAKQWQESVFVDNALNRVWDPGFTARVMARVCNPEWRNSWDQPESTTVEHIGNVTINRITKPN